MLGTLFWAWIIFEVCVEHSNQLLSIGVLIVLQDPVWKHRKDRHDTTTDPSFDYEAWKVKHTTFADQAVPRWVKAVGEQYKKDDAKVACVGYCFGAPYVCNELAGDTVTAGAFAHPAFLKEHHFRNVKSKSNAKLRTLRTFQLIRDGRTAFSLLR